MKPRSHTGTTQRLIAQRGSSRTRFHKRTMYGYTFDDETDEVSLGKEWDRLLLGLDLGVVIKACKEL